MDGGQKITKAKASQCIGEHKQEFNIKLQNHKKIAGLICTKQGFTSNLLETCSKLDALKLSWTTDGVTEDKER